MKKLLIFTLLTVLEIVVLAVMDRLSGLPFKLPLQVLWYTFVTNTLSLTATSGLLFLILTYPYVTSLIQKQRTSN